MSVRRTPHALGCRGTGYGPVFGPGGDVTANINPFTVVSCDNLRHTGEVARAAFVGFANARDPDVGAWIDSNVTFPNSLADRITPSVSAEDAARLNAAGGLDDQIPLVAEDITQWVIEDRFVDGRPARDEAGVQFSDEVKVVGAGD